MPTRGGNKGKHSLASSEAISISRKGTMYTIAQRGVMGRYIQLTEDELYELDDLIGKALDKIEQ